MKNKSFVIGPVVLAVLAFLSFKFFAPAPSKMPAPVAAGPASFVRDYSASFGNSLARVTVVEWFDPECESCRMIHPIVKKIIEEYKDRVHFVFRYMPYHENSMFAATALEEAKEHNKYEEALDVLFENQPAWGDHHAPRPDLIPGYLIALGIPAEKLEQESLLKKHGDKIRLDQTDGERVGVNGTPTFFVNEKMVPELGERPLRNAIEAALK